MAADTTADTVTETVTTTVGGELVNNKSDFSCTQIIVLNKDNIFS